MPRAILILGLAVSLLPGCAIYMGEGLKATPQRPTLSSDTNTTVEGSFELEAGGLWDPEDKGDTPLVLKYGLGKNSEIYVGWSPYVKLIQPGTDPSGQSDVVLGMRTRFREETDDMPSMAVQVAGKIPAGSSKEGISSGENDFLAAAIFSKSINDLGVTAFYQAGFLGEADGPDTDIEHSLALAMGHPLDEDWSLFAELATIQNHEQSYNPLFLTYGAALQIADNMVFDTGFVSGLNDDGPQWQVFMGVTINFGKPGDTHRIRTPENP